MSGAWAIVPILPLIVSAALFASFIIVLSTVATPGTSAAAAATALATFFGFLFLFFAALFLVSILVVIMIFFLVRRRNNHFNRQILLCEDLVTAAKELASRRNVDVSVLFNNLDRSVREARLEELEKNATLWALVGLVPFGQWYSYYFLMKDFYRHERREDLFVQDFLRTLYQLGIPINLPYRSPPIPDRSFALYFVINLITGGIFGIYWVYVLVSDPNNHFRQQMMIEDTIMAQVSSVLFPAVPSSSSSPPPPPQPPAST